MSTERPEQYDMFTGELKDNRTRKQKSNARKQEQSHQGFLFSQRDLAQQSKKRYFPLAPNTKLDLISEDPRTDEEKEQDRLLNAQKLNEQLFDDPEGV